MECKVLCKNAEFQYILQNKIFQRHPKFDKVVFNLKIDNADLAYWYTSYTSQNAYIGLNTSFQNKLPQNYYITSVQICYICCPVRKMFSYTSGDVSQCSRLQTRTYSNRSKTLENI
jgi:hypothetical protein